MKCQCDFSENETEIVERERDESTLTRNVHIDDVTANLTNEQGNILRVALENEPSTSSGQYSARTVRNIRETIESVITSGVENTTTIHDDTKDEKCVPNCDQANLNDARNVPTESIRINYIITPRLDENNNEIYYVEPSPIPFTNEIISSNSGMTVGQYVEIPTTDAPIANLSNEFTPITQNQDDIMNENIVNNVTLSDYNIHNFEPEPVNVSLVDTYIDQLLHEMHGDH